MAEFPVRCTRAYAAGETLFLLPRALEGAFSSLPAVYREGGAYCAPIPVGSRLSSGEDAVFQVTGHCCLHTDVVPHAVVCPVLTVLRDCSQAEESRILRSTKEGFSLAWITLSDRGAAGERQDLSGPGIADLVSGSIPLCFSQGFLLPDSSSELRALLGTLALRDQYDLVCTTGGTGLSSRDVTPETTRRVLDLELTGIVHAMMAGSLQKTPHAMLSRACAGVLGRCLIINLPGSARAVKENLEAVLPALPHALAKLHDDPTDCGG